MLWQNIFWAFLSELFFLIVAIILKDDKRKVVTVLVAGTIISGIIGFWLPTFLPNSNLNPGATTLIESIADVHNIVENGQNGMGVYVSFRIVGKKDVPCKVYVRFFDGNTGSGLTDTNGEYVRPNGQVSAGEDFTPQSNNSYYDDLMIFIPYEELHLTGTGRHNLKYDVVLFDYQVDQIIDYSDFKYFELMIE